MYGFGAWMYMADVGRWFAIDRLNEKYLNISPFVYAANNQLRYIDPDGRNMDSTIGDPIKKVEWNPNKPGGENNPAPIEEVIIGEISDMGISNADTTFLGFILQTMTNYGNKLDNTLTEAFFGLGSQRSMLNYQKNLSNYQLAVMNSKGAREVEEFEKFLFLDLPASFAGGELLSVGWRAGMSRFICQPLSRLSNGLIKLCFTEGTLVATEDGNRKIEDIKEGDQVWSYNEATGRKELKKWWPCPAIPLLPW